MKPKFTALLASAILALPLSAQTVVIGPGVNNGDLETAGDTTPFLPDGGTDSTDFNHTSGGSRSLKIDLTANNANGQWKGIASDTPTPGTAPGGIEADVNEGENVIASVWVYIPSSTTFGTAINGQNRIIGQIEGYNSSTMTWGGLNFTSFNVTGGGAPARDQWVKLQLNDVTIPENVTKIRTRAWNLTTAASFPDPADSENPYDAFDWTDGERTVASDKPATPAIWSDNGYSGSIYLDDFALTINPPIPDGVGILGPIRNGDLEAAELTPFGAQPYQSISDTDEGGFNHTPDGSQSLGIDLSFVGGNQWKGLSAGSHVSLPVSPGETITESVWVYVPTGTVWPTPVCNFHFKVHTNTTQEVGPITNLKTMVQGQWNQITNTYVVSDGETVTDTSKWYIQIGASAEDASEFAGIKVYFDDFEMTSMVAPPPPPLEVVVGPGINNGDMEAATLAPFNAVGGTKSTDQNHTPAGANALSIDLTANNSNGQWKGIVPGGFTANLAGDNDTVNMTAWVYIPGSTTFGPTANLNFELRTNPGNVFNAGAPTLNLTTAARDTWIQVESLGIPVAAGATQISLGNWNLETVTMVGAGGDIPANAATPADWQAAGYDGVIFIDDVQIELNHPQGPDIQVTSVSYEDGVGTTIEFISQVGNVDVWKNSNGDLDPENYVEWDVDQTSPYLDVDGDASVDPKAFYILVPTGEIPFE